MTKTETTDNVEVLRYDWVNWTEHGESYAQVGGNEIAARRVVENFTISRIGFVTFRDRIAP